MSWLLLVGIALVFIGFIVASVREKLYGDKVGIGVGFLIVIVGIVLAIVGVIGLQNESNTADAAGISQVLAAAEAQDLVITDPYRTGATVIGDKCTLPADLVDGKLVLSGPDPDIVLTPDYVDLVCQGAAR